MTVKQRIDLIRKQFNSSLCIGLDPDLKLMPDKYHGDIEAFNRAIIDTTIDLVGFYKVNSAFYEAMGSEGIEILQNTCRYLRQKQADVFIILDAKRGDIGNTNQGYVQFAYEYLGVDAITLHPYVGQEALEPFLSRYDKGSIILCHTSNPGAGEFQDLSLEGLPLYLHIAHQVSQVWNKHENCLLVVGATYPPEIAAVRQVARDIPILVPGLGAQGGDLASVIVSGKDTQGQGLLLAQSRGIIFADNPRQVALNFQESERILL